MSKTQLGLTAIEEKEFLRMWNGWCWSTQQGRGMPCTRPKNHKGGHSWDAKRWTKFMKLRVRLPDWNLPYSEERSRFGGF